MLNFKMASADASRLTTYKAVSERSIGAIAGGLGRLFDNSPSRRGASPSTPGERHEQEAHTAMQKKERK